MSRYERNLYFERLVAMRVTYAQRDDDIRGVLPIEDAIDYAEAVLTAWELENELEMAIVADAGAVAASGRTTAAADRTREEKRAERVARLTRFFDPLDRPTSTDQS